MTPRQKLWRCIGAFLMSIWVAAAITDFEFSFKFLFFLILIFKSIDADDRIGDLEEELEKLKKNKDGDV